MEENKHQAQSQSNADDEEPGLPFDHAKGQQVINPNQATKSKRGRKAIPPQWSRIIDLGDEDPDD